MSLTITAALSFAFSQILLSVILLFKSKRRWSLQEWLFFLFLCSVLAYLFGPLLEKHWLSPAQRALENTLPGLFWLLCGCLFNDRFKIRWWHTMLVAMTVVLPTIAKNLDPNSTGVPDWLFISIPQLTEFILIGWALFLVIQSWRDDLIEIRRDLRVWFCSMAGVYIFLMITIREVLFPDATWWSELQYLPIGVIGLFTNVLLLQYRPGVLLYKHDERFTQLNRKADSGSPTSTPEIAQERPSQPIEVPEEIVIQLTALMNEERIYREMGLTIGQVAKRLDLQEYQLRRMINAGLGYRNFNDYLNGFRIKEAGERLSDPDQTGEAILNIALDIGFRSLSSFNKAFKEAYGRTPSEYRKQAGSAMNK